MTGATGFVGRIVLSLHMGSTRSVARGVTVFDGTELGPNPIMFMAETVNVYDVPLASSHSVHAVAWAEVVHDARTGFDVTTHLVIALPPSDFGLNQLTVAKPLPADAWTDCGTARRTLALALE